MEEVRKRRIGGGMEEEGEEKTRGEGGEGRKASMQKRNERRMGRKRGGEWGGR